MCVSFSRFSDINECTDDSADCDQNADCTNTAGSYDCACQIGFTGDGFECVGKPELTQEPTRARIYT